MEKKPRKGQGPIAKFVTEERAHNRRLAVLVNRLIERMPLVLQSRGRSDEMRRILEQFVRTGKADFGCGIFFEQNHSLFLLTRDVLRLWNERWNCLGVRIRTGGIDSVIFSTR